MAVETNILKLSDGDLDDKKIIVKHSGFVELQHNKDPDGDLVIAETARSLPLDECLRTYRRHVRNPDATLGHHAHKNTKQIIFCAVGSFVLHLDDGQNEQDILMDVEYIGVKLWPKLWHSMSNFGNFSLLLVHADKYFDELGESDYIRDYAQFLEYIKSGH